MTKQLKILISGGGTGGHIFPAIAIANEIKHRYPQVDILFVGAEGKMEMEKVPAAGYKITGLWISGFNRSLDVRNLSFPFKLLASYFKAGSIVKKFKPDVAIGTGGFASGPAINAAIRHNVPAVIQEQNSYPGITNKILARRAKKICVAYDGMEKYFPHNKTIKTGNPVRRDVVSGMIGQEKARMEFGLQTDDKVLLVIGGSLGSLTLNNCIINSIEAIQNAGLKIIWQTGAIMYNECVHAAKTYAGIHAIDFIQNIGNAYAAADIIVSRAGAIAISEMCLVGKPVILVPFPFAADDHQTKNAMSLVKENAAIHISDKDAPQQLIAEAVNLMNDKAKQQQFSNNIKKLAVNDAAERIADEIDKLIKP